MGGSPGALARCVVSRVDMALQPLAGVSMKESSWTIMYMWDMCVLYVGQSVK